MFCWKLALLLASRRRSGVISQNTPGCLPAVPGAACHSIFNHTTGLDQMNTDSDSTLRGNLRSASPTVELPDWVNERIPPLTEILSAHDVARLTRRPCWQIVGLALIGRFPKKTRFRGRPIGWCRTDVLAWMARDLVLEPQRPGLRRCTHRTPQQRCLPLNGPIRSGKLRN